MQKVDSYRGNVCSGKLIRWEGDAMNIGTSSSDKKWLKHPMGQNKDRKGADEAPFASHFWVHRV